jgi:hypothetical protein
LKFILARLSSLPAVFVRRPADPRYLASDSRLAVGAIHFRCAQTNANRAGVAGSGPVEPDLMRVDW